jgi:signal transduction histidine kinase
MRSLRTRLLALWLMLAMSAAAIGFVLLEFYRQSANSQIMRAEDAIARSCRDIGERYAFVVAGWNGSTSSIDDALKQRLVEAVQTALARAPGVEGGIWQADAGSLAYAFPTYEGTGPKTDLPEAERASIRQVNSDVARSERPLTVRQTSRSQVLLLHACPIAGVLPNATGWTMARVFTGQGPAYNQLLIGLAVLAVTVLGSAIWLGSILLSWSGKLWRLEASLASRIDRGGDLPALPLTGERELDRLVEALNATGKRVGEERRRASAAERLAAIGRLAAGVAHEIRNPIAAMRLKAENAIASSDEDRRMSALQSILQQIGRLDGLLRDLLAMSQRHEPEPAEAALGRFLKETSEPHRELAAAKGVSLQVMPVPGTIRAAKFDIDQVRRALDNLLLNALQNTPPGGVVTVAAMADDGKLQFRVSDTGPGVPAEVRDRLFEPFATARAYGTGLGLAIAREIARAHGGEARLVSTTSSGAVFEIELPWRPS